MYEDEDYGIMGLEDVIMGDLDMEPGEVGLSRRRKRRRRRLAGFFTGGLSTAIRKARSRGRKRARRSHQQSAKPVTHGGGIMAGSQRQAALGLGAVVIALSSTGQLQATCQRAFQPQRLVAAQSGPATGTVLITDITLGVRSQFAGVTSMPIEAFQPDAQNTAMQFDPMGLGMVAALNISNTDAANAATISAALLGTASD